MIHTPHVDWFSISTILVLLGASFVALLGAVLVPKPWRRAFSAGVAVLGSVGGLVTSVWLYVDSSSGHRVIANAYYRDRWTALAQVILCAIGLATALMSAEQIVRRNDEHVAEYFSLLLAATAGMTFFVGAANLMTLFLALEWFSIALYVMCAIGLATALMSAEQIVRRNDEHVAEYFSLLLAATAGMTFFVGAANLMTLFLALEWFSIALYVMCAIDYDVEGSLEAGLKYLIVGSFGSASLLFGSALVYGATNRIGFAEIAQQVGRHGLSGDLLLVLGLAMLLAGLAFKSSAAPFHMWTPDVYQGAPTPVTAFMSAATKVAAFVLTVRVLRTAFPQEAHLWTWALAGIAVASLVIGNLAALVQKDVKRMLAYSSVSHAGFILIGVAAGSALGGRAVMYYLIPYSAMAFGSFAVVAVRERELGAPVTLDNLAGFGWERPFLGVAMWFFMFGFAGLPLGGGFVGKFYVLAAAYRHGWAWLVVVGVLATLVSLYYYLGVVRALYMRPGEELRVATVAGGSPARDPLTQAAVGLALAVSVGSLFAVEPLIELAKHAASSLPF